MSVPSRKKWTPSVPRPRLLANDDKSVSSPSEMLLPARRRRPRSKGFEDEFAGRKDHGLSGYGIKGPVDLALLFGAITGLGIYDDAGRGLHFKTVRYDRAADET